MKCLTMLLWLSACLALSNTIAAQNNPWKFRHDHNGVQVYTRKDSATGILELKLRTEVRASLNAVVALATDIPNLKNWAYRLKESHLVRGVNETEGYLYMRTDFPLPFSDRDMVVHYVMKQDPNTKQVTSVSKSAHHLIPEKEGVVRIKILETKWTYTPLPSGLVRLEYQLKSDPAGNIPKWLVNLAADDGPVKSIMGLKQQLGKYEKANVGFLRE
ncbi:MAG TPA: START domain-containing protein [Haliscomenobacter sp.]|nr:START domain-containing protein [Haliscomenobacter sp.]